MSITINGTTGIAGVDGSASTPAIQGNDTNTGMFFPAADTIAFAEGGVEVARFDSSGNLGLGVTPSAWGGSSKILQISNAAFRGAGNSAYVGANYYFDGSNNRYIASAAASLYEQDAGRHIFYTAPSGTAGNAISFTQAMTLASTGNLGITGSSFDINPASGNPNITLREGNTFRGYIEANANGLLFGTGPAAAERMRIDSSGNVGIGTSSPSTYGRFGVVSGANFFGVAAGTFNSASFGPRPANDGFCSLTYYWSTLASGNFWVNDYTSGAVDWQRYVGGSGSGTLMRLDSSGNLLVGTTTVGVSATSGFTALQTTGATYVFVGHTSGTASGSNYAAFSLNGTQIGSITQNGTTGVTYGTSSDYRLKENIQPMTGALAKVAALKPCTYTWKSAPDEIGEGFIAHELAEVCPQAVTGEKDAVNEDGSIKPQSIDTSFLVATLTAAIQEQQAIIEQLTTRIVALEAK